MDVNLLSRAKHEIEWNRRRLELLEAQMHVVHIFGAALLGRMESQPQSIDVAWELGREIDRLLKAKQESEIQPDFEMPTPSNPEE